MVLFIIIVLKIAMSDPMDGVTFEFNMFVHDIHKRPLDIMSVVLGFIRDDIVLFVFLFSIGSGMG